MSNEGFKPDQKVLLQVEALALSLSDKITDEHCEESKKVIGFGFFVYHEDGSIATDAIGYWDRERVQARMSNFLQSLSLIQQREFSQHVFDPGRTGEPTLTNEQARPQLWRGF